MSIRINMCGIDRVLRIITSILLIYVSFWDSEIIANEAIRFMVGGFGLLNLVSACIGFCPVYFMAHISTQRESK